MRLEGNPQPKSTAPTLDPDARPGTESRGDGDFPIEQDGGTVDTGSQVQIPPRPPA